MDWTNLAQVVAYAIRLGPGQVVIKHYDRPNYNITHAERRDRWDRPGVVVVHRT